VKGIAFTDSVHSRGKETKKKGSALLASRARNWVKSKKPLDTQIDELSSYQVWEVENEVVGTKKKKWKCSRMKSTLCAA
jgi:hypothetical protein